MIRHLLVRARSHRGRAKLPTMLAVVAAFLIGVPSALAESATSSPTGMLTVSVPSPVSAGVAATYTMTLTNTTSSAMSGIVANGDMPSGMSVQRINGCARLGGNQSASFLCTMPNLAPGASESATVSILASSTGTFTIPFSVSGGVAVPGSPGALQIFGETAELSVNVQPGATDLQVTGSASNGAPPVGSAFTYAFQVKNNGPLPATGVTFDDSLPSAILLGANLTTDRGTCTASVLSNSVHCDIGSLGVGQQADISFSASPTAAGAFGNTASVAMDGADIHPANNSVTVTVQPK